MNFAAQIEKYILHFQQQLKFFFKTQQNFPVQLFEAIHYCVLNGGKYIRPLLVYCSGESLGIQHLKLDSIAIALELIHVYSLIHDDLPAMDNAKLRRGKPACHIKFGEAEAILAGDALQTLAMEVLTNAAYISDSHKIKLLRLLTSACGPQGMVGGQSLDITAEGKLLNIEQLKEIHRLKTGKLIAACIMMPASLAAISLPIESLEKVANLLGIAYQIQDDLLDVESTTELLGKEQGLDIKLAKNTYPKLIGLTGSKNYLIAIKQEIFQIFEKNNLIGSKLSQLIEFIFNRKY